MDRPDHEIMVSWDRNDYEIFPDDGQEEATLEDITAASEWSRPNRRGTVYVPFPGRDWEFHKTDADPWPSVLHGHHSTKLYKLDGLTGEIWKIQTRKKVGRVKRKELIRIQLGLLNSHALGEKTALLLGPARVQELRAGR